MKTKLVTLLLCSVVLVIQGCNEERVSVPPPAQDKPPVVTIHAVPSGQSGRVAVGQVSSPSCAPDKACRVHATIGTDILITADAVNPGGVQSLTVELRNTATPPFETLLAVTTMGARDQNNKVPKSLGIIGHNGAGSIGSNPLLIHVTQQTGVQVVATATNFNGMTTKVAVVYYPLLPVIAHIEATPNTIERGQQTVLLWNTESASTIKIEPLGIAGSGLDSWGGSRTVSPQQTTTYALSATNFLYDECTLPNKKDCQGAEIVQKSIPVNVIPPTQTTGGLSGSYYFDAVGSEHFDITVLFSGTLTSSSGTTGDTAFSIPVTANNLAPGTNLSVSFSKQGLRKGTWRVRAQPSAIAAPIECNAVVPGTVKLIVAGGTGPKCSP